MRSEQDIEKLKRDWQNDPCWDIEETEGFEDHYAELLSFRLEKERKWKEVAKEKLKKKASEYGIPYNLKLTETIYYLNQEIIQLREMVEKLMERQ